MAQSFLVAQVKSQLVKLIESYEPQLEQGLRDSLTKIKASNPSEAAIFLQKWKMLDGAVIAALGAPGAAPVASAKPGFFSRGGKRTKRHTRKRTK